MNLIFLGPPGAGKGTQAQIICQKLRIPQISTGDMLRSAIANKTETGLAAKAYMDAGQLVPDDVVIAIVKECLGAPDCQNGYVLDGFPRTVAQAQALDGFAEMDRVIDLNVPDETLVARLSGRRVCPACGAPYHIHSLNGATACAKCGATLVQRDDDQPATVQSRLTVYHEKTAPLIAYYREQGKLIPIAGDGDLATITATILKALEAVR